MVATRIVRSVIALLIGIAVASAGVSMLLPSISDHPGEHCAALLIKASVAAYREKHGHFSEDFLTHRELLNAIAGPRAAIRKHDQVGYNVDVCCAGSLHRVHLDYHVGVNNKLEKYNVFGIDRLGVCNESVDRFDK